MNDSFSQSYKDAGVDITAGYKAVDLMKPYIEKTFTKGVLGGVGGFGGCFEPALGGVKRPVLVAGTDGVGTKLMIARVLDKHDTIGIDCVAMCANDIACQGAAPIFFLDYIACGKNIPERMASIIKGVSDGCVQAGCALIGGETAEHPGVMPDDDYDLAGFCVGLADHDDIITGKDAAAGDVLIGIASSGAHSNGFSLIRKVFGIGKTSGALSRYVPEFGKTLGEELLTPTIIYVKPLLDLMKTVKVHAVCNITGGGFYENVPRMLGQGGLCAVIERGAVKTPPVFGLIAREGGVPERDMWNTFNMGVGMALAVAAVDAEKAVDSLKASGLAASVIGEIKPGDKGVDIL